jgi:hypothetical protein
LAAMLKGRMVEGPPTLLDRREPVESEAEGVEVEVAAKVFRVGRADELLKEVCLVRRDGRQGVASLMVKRRGWSVGRIPSCRMRGSSSSCFCCLGRISRLVKFMTASYRLPWNICCER